MDRDKPQHSLKDVQQQQQQQQQMMQPPDVYWTLCQHHQQQQQQQQCIGAHQLSLTESVRVTSCDGGHVTEATPPDLYDAEPRSIVRSSHQLSNQCSRYTPMTAVVTSSRDKVSGVSTFACGSVGGQQTATGKKLTMTSQPSPARAPAHLYDSPSVPCKCPSNILP